MSKISRSNNAVQQGSNRNILFLWTKTLRQIIIHTVGKTRKKFVIKLLRSEFQISVDLS